MNNKESALVIVAHPDDETIWMGGVIKHYKNINWYIFSLCRKDDKDRAPKFHKVCRYYGAQGTMSDLEDEGLMSVKKSLPEIEKRLRKLRQKKYNRIFTHGANGEYGHPRHIGVHQAVKKLVRSKKIRCDQLIFFAYHLDKQRRIINSPKNKTGFFFPLTTRQLRAKKNVIKKLYGFSSKSFENISCLKKETFNIYQ